METKTNQDKIILDLCGGTGAWSHPYAEAGYDVRNITLPSYDVRSYWAPKSVYGILVAPPCTEFSLAKTTGSPRNLKEGMEVVIACLNIVWKCQYELKSPHAKETKLKFWALENPNGLLKRFLGKPSFQFNPYDFGDNYKKNTYLWGYFNAPVKSPITCTKPKFDQLLTKEIHPEFYGELTRTERRAITPAGFAKAFFKANQ